MSSGAKLAQSCHCAFTFAIEHFEITKNWINISNYITILEINDEYNLNIFLSKIKERNIIYSVFREPNMNNEITAIALEPGEKSKKLCRSLKLAG